MFAFERVHTFAHACVHASIHNFNFNPLRRAFYSPASFALYSQFLYPKGTNRCSSYPFIKLESCRLFPIWKKCIFVYHSSIDFGNTIWLLGFRSASTERWKLSKNCSRILILNKKIIFQYLIFKSLYVIHRFLIIFLSSWGGEFQHLFVFWIQFFFCDCFVLWKSERNIKFETFYELNFCTSL